MHVTVVSRTWTCPLRLFLIAQGSCVVHPTDARLLWEYRGRVLWALRHKWPGSGSPCRHHLDLLAPTRVQGSVQVLVRRVLLDCVSRVLKTSSDRRIPGFARRGPSNASATGSSSEGAINMDSLYNDVEGGCWTRSKTRAVLNKSCLRICQFVTRYRAGHSATPAH